MVRGGAGTSFAESRLSPGVFFASCLMLFPQFLNSSFHHFLTEHVAYLAKLQLLG
jgi:hypothetical protein